MPNVCDLDGYLFCKMPAETLEVEIKIKTKWGTEKYHAWEKADRRSNVRTRKRKAPYREMTNMQTEDNTSKTDVPVGQGFRYPLRSSQTLGMQQQYPTWRKKKKSRQVKVSS